MPLGVGFLKDVAGFWKQNGAKLAPKWHQKSIPTSNGDFLKKLRFSLRKKPWFWRIWGSKLKAKINQKSIKKWSYDGKPSWHRFFTDFLRFWRPKWSQVGRKINKKSIQKGIQKQMRKSSRLGRLLAASWVNFGHGPRAAVPRRSPPPTFLSVEG